MQSRNARNQERNGELASKDEMGGDGIQGKKNRKGKKNTNDHKMKIKLEGLDGRTGTVKNRKKKKKRE